MNAFWMEYFGVDWIGLDNDIADAVDHLSRRDSQMQALADDIRLRELRQTIPSDSTNDEDNQLNAEVELRKMVHMKTQLKDVEGKHPRFFASHNHGPPVEMELYPQEYYSDVSSRDVGYSTDGWDTNDDDHLANEQDGDDDVFL